MCNHVDLLTQSTCLRAKISQSTHNEKIKLLTLVPQSWTCDKVVKRFSVSHCFARKARSLKKTKGLLADPGKKQKNLAMVYL